MEEKVFTKYERARIIGARALQVSMDAPLLVKIDKEKLEEIRYNAIQIAEIELDSGVLPITVKRPMPERKEGKLKKEKEKVKDAEIEHKESLEEKEIIAEGEIMELAKPEDEVEEESSGEEEPEI